MENIKSKTKELAQRQYLSLAFRDQTTEGEPIYVALNPELEGCIAQGETMQEALDNLGEMRIDYIEHLLEHRLPVPEPARIGASQSEKVASAHVIKPEPLRKLALDEVTQPPPSDQPVLVTS